MVDIGQSKGLKFERTLAEWFTPHLPEAKTDLLKQRRGQCKDFKCYDQKGRQKKKKTEVLHNAYYGAGGKTCHLVSMGVPAQIW